MKVKKQKNSLFIFLLLVILFLFPLVLAVILYKSNPLWLHENTVNKGQLIFSGLNLHKIKVVPFKVTLSLLHQQAWFLFYLATSPCHELCQKNLHTMRQITLALGKNSHRIRYGLIQVIEKNAKKMPRNTLANPDPNLLIYALSNKELHYFYSTLNSTGKPEAYYLADPSGTIILYYSRHVTGEDIYQDLTRILTHTTTG
jgi:hypothetical protein